MTQDIVERMRAAQEAAQLPIAAFAWWLCQERQTVGYWLSGRSRPARHTAYLLPKHLDLLDRALAEKRLPVPETINQYGRRAYLRELKDAYNGRVSGTRPAAQRDDYERRIAERLKS
jgi:hypothetical protein